MTMRKVNCVCECVYQEEAIAVVRERRSSGAEESRRDGADHLQQRTKRFRFDLASQWAREM